MYDGVVELVTFWASEYLIWGRFGCRQDRDSLLFVFVGGTAWYTGQVFDSAT